MKKTTAPLVSVILPVYNSADFLREAIDSILNQTYTNFELIIVDDASTDNSLTILKEYVKKFPNKITLISLKKNLNCGGDACANIALSEANGKYIARMDADDISHPERLEKQVAYLESHPSVFLVGSSAVVVNKEGAQIGNKMEPISTKSIYQAYFTFHPLIHPTTTFRRLTKKGPFSYRIKHNANNDYYTFFSLMCEGEKFVNLPDRLLSYRIHGKNDTFVHMKRKFMNTLKIRIEMVAKKGYRPSLLAVFMTLVQGAIILSMPERVITQLYFLSKGIKKASLPSLSLRRLAVVK